MKIAIISDTHGYIDEVIKRLRKNPVDLIIHLGDYCNDALEIEKLTGIKTYVVRGNNDYTYSGNIPNDLIISIKGLKFFITHGHRYGVYWGIDKVLEKAKALDVQIALYGHSHIYFNEKIDGVWIINPGSPTYPRGGDKKSFVVLDLETMNLERIIMKES